MATGKRQTMKLLLIIAMALLLLFAGPAAVAQDGDENPEAEDEEEEDEDTASTPPPSSVIPANQPDLRNADGLVTLDFDKKDINEVIKFMSEITGRNFMVDKSVSGQVTIISPQQVSPREAYDICLSILAVNGFTTVEVGKITKVIPRKDAKQSPISTVTGRMPRSTDEIITQLIPLANIDCNDVASAFTNLVGPDGDLFAYGPSNMVIVSDSASNVNRLYRIIMQLDTSGAEQNIEVILLEYAGADQMAEMIMQLFEEGLRSSMMSSAARRFSTGRTRSRSRVGGLRTGTKSTNIPGQSIPNIIADMRTNSLVVKGSTFGIKRVKEIVEKLDQPLPGGEGKIHVVYLQNADAEEMAATLAQLAGGGGGVGGTGLTGRSGRNTRSGYGGRNTRAGQLAGRLGSSGLSSLGGRYGGAAGRFGTTGRGSAYGRQGIAQTAGRLLADFDGAVRITADPPTNSLVIVASNRDYKILEEVIQKLDIPRRQVFVEAVIMEITMEKGLDLGFEFRSTNDASEDGIQVIGGSNYGGITEAAANPLGVAGFAIGAADGTIEYAGTEYPNIGALFRAMQTDKDVNVLSTPNLLTMDNEEAEIVVADNIPFVTGQIFSQANNNPTTTIERQDVGITLRITPQINESDYVRLEIYQESSSVTDSPEGLTAAEVGVTTSKRTASTLVVVKDRQTVIIGGLLKDTVSNTEAKVPVLGDIPILGYLFKSNSKNYAKTNLLIFLTPYIIKDAADLEEVTRMSNYRMQYFRESNRHPLKSSMEEFYINDESMTPSQDIFRAPKQGIIETDPRIRRQQEKGKSGDDDNNQPGQGVPPDDEDDQDQPEDFTQ